MDRTHAQRGEIKDVYALALTKYFREILCTTDIGATLPVIVQTPAKGPEEIPGNWAEEEFGGADFGDHRLHRGLL